MKIRFANKIAAAAAAGLISAACGESAPEPQTPATSAGDDGAATGDDEAATDTADEGVDEGGEEQAACCKGMNECKGKGGCAVAGKHDCQGKNECKGQGGCNHHCPDQQG